MRFSSRIAANADARRITLSALASDARSLRLKRCRALLKVLDPELPPTADQAREFRWQYRALLERVQMYAERLDTVEESLQGYDHTLQKAETALELSLRYFNHALNFAAGFADDDAGV
jgi:hypothetical protein